MLAVTTTLNNGLRKNWTPNTAYALGDNVDVGNAVYRATKAGTTGAASPLSSTRPSCSTVAPAPCPEFVTEDGSVTWFWINDSAIGGKLGIYNEVKLMPGEGSAWGSVDNVEMTTGFIPTFVAAREIDLINNFGKNCIVGKLNCFNGRINLGESDRSTAHLHLEESGASSFASVYRILMAGSNATRDHDISIQSSAAVGIDIGSFGGAAHSVASIRDMSTSPIRYHILNTLKRSIF